MDEKKLLDLKKKIDTAKVKVNQLEGRKKGLMESLQEDWGCEDVEQAEEKLADLEAEIEKLDSKIEQGVKKIEEKYEFD